MADKDGDGVADNIDPDPNNPDIPNVRPVTGGTAGTGATGGTVSNEGIVTSDTQTKTFSVVWNVDPRTGEPTSFVSKEGAYKYLTRKAPDWKAVNTAFASYGGALTNTNNVTSFWKKIVNEAAGTSSTPDDIIKSYRAQYLAEKRAAATPKVSTSSYFSFTDKATAYADITKLFKETFGIDPNAEQKRRYYNQINAAEKKSGSVTTYTTVNGVTTQTTRQTKFDAEQIKQQVIADTITAYNKKYPGKKLLGTAGSLQGDLSTYANKEMGLDMSDREINILVAKVLGGTNIQDAYKEIKRNAVDAYGNFAKTLKEDNPGDLRQGSTVRSLANNYIQMMANTLELNPDDIKVTDSAISNLITGDKLPSISEAKKTFRQDKRWNNTQAAVEESKQLGYSLLRAFGYNV
jgi:hypothetical protein